MVSASRGDAPEALRQVIRERFGVRHCELMSTGRAGLTVLLRAMRRLMPADRDEVVLPSYTCYSVAASIAKAGLRPRLVDVRPDTLDFAPEALARSDFSRVVAVIATNLYGVPSDLPGLASIARRQGVFLIDDAAQAMGASVGGRWSGTWGDAGLFSFDKGKNISAIDGGVVVTSSDDIGRALRPCQGPGAVPGAVQGPRWGAGSANGCYVSLRPANTSYRHHDAGDDAGGDDSWHRGLHESRAGERQSRGQARRCLVVRRRAARDAHGPAPLRRRDGGAYLGRCAARTPGFQPAARRHAHGDPRSAAALFDARREEAHPRHRRRPHRNRRGADVARIGGPDRFPDPRSPILPWAIAGALGVGLVATLGLSAPWRADAPVDRPLVRLDVDLGADVSLPAPGQAGSSVVISPDGTRLVYASGTPPRLFIRRLDQPNAVELPGTQDATAPFFSPDGQWVGFAAGRGISKISVDGGAIVPLGDVAAFRGASWDADGSVVAASSRDLRRVVTGSVPQALAAAAGSEVGLSRPQVLPGGTAVLFTVDIPGDVNQSTIQVLTLADGQRKTVISGGASGRYLATADGAGHLVYLNKSTLFAVPFDLTTLETRGDAVPIVNDVASEGLAGVGQFDVSGTGTLVYRRDTGRGSALNSLQWVDVKGGREPLPAAPANYLGPRVSPDGTRVVLWTVGQQGTDVVIYDPQRDVTTRLPSTNQDNWAVWSPDGRHVVFRRTGVGLLQARADGARQPQVLIPAAGNTPVPFSFTPDGRWLAYSTAATGTLQIWTVAIEDRGRELHAGTPAPFLKSQFADSQPAFSPDGCWLAYQSNESGTDEVYVRPFPPPASGQGSRWQVSNTGGTFPRWSRNGRELICQAGDQLMAVAYTVNGDAFVSGKARVWIAALGGTNTGGEPPVWDLAPDGTRVLVVMPAAGADATKAEHHVVFLQNFFDELRRKVPLGK